MNRRLRRVIAVMRQEGLQGVLLRVRRKLWPLQRHLIYRTESVPQICKSDGIDIVRYRSVSEIGTGTFDRMAELGAIGLPPAVNRAFAAGRELWLAMLPDGRVAGIGWSASGRSRRDYFVHLDAGDSILLGYYVLPSMRGRGVYRMLISTAADALVAEHGGRVYIDCKIWNKPSKRGIEKAGFKLLGEAWGLEAGSLAVRFGRSWDERRRRPYARRGLLVRCIYLCAAVVWWVLTGFGLFGRGGVIVLCYHNILPRHGERFRRQMQQIRSRAVDVEWGPKRGIRLGERLRVAVTFDDAFARLCNEAIPTIARFGIPCSVFVPAGNLNRPPQWQLPLQHDDLDEPVMSEPQLRGIAAIQGVRLGSHCMTHRDLTTLSASDILRELTESRQALSRLAGRAVEDVAFPHGAYNVEVIRASQEAGYRRMFTLNERPVRSSSGLMGRFSVSPDMWSVEFMLTCAGAYSWLEGVRGLIRRVRDRRGRLHAARRSPLTETVGV